MRKYNLFFVGTPLTYISAEKIVKFFENGGTNILFSTRPQNKRFIQQENWSAIFEVYPPKFHPEKRGFLNKLKIYKENLRKVVVSCENAEEINFHASILDNRDVNFFINGIRRHFKNTRFNIRIVPEGLLNVARHPLSYKKIYRQFTKKTWKIFSPELDFYMFSGDITGADDPLVDRIYLLPNLPHEYDEKKVFYIPSMSNLLESSLAFPDTALVLGQPLVKCGALKATDGIKISEEIQKFIQSNGYRKILYKPHQRDENNELKQVEYATLSIEEALETHFLKNHYGMVIGVSSTALLTAKMILPKSSRVVSLGMNKNVFKDDRHREKIYAPFRALELEVYDSI